MTTEITLKKSSLHWFYNSLTDWQVAIVQEELKVADKFEFAVHPEAIEFVLQAKMYGVAAGWPSVNLDHEQYMQFVVQYPVPKSPDEFWAIPPGVDDGDNFLVEQEPPEVHPGLPLPASASVAEALPKPAFWRRSNPAAWVALLSPWTLCGLCNCALMTGNAFFTIFGWLVNLVSTGGAGGY